MTISKEQKTPDNNPKDKNNDDSKMIEIAKEVTLSYGKVSPSFLQRKLSIGYARACRIIETLEEEKFIGPYDSSIRAHIILAKEKNSIKTTKRKTKTTPKDITPQEDQRVYSAALHTERDMEWEIESIKRQYQERIDYLMKSDKTEKQKQKEKQILLENSLHDPRLPNIFYNSKETAKERRKIARRLDSLKKEDFLTLPYVLEWSQNKPQKMTWLFPAKGDITTFEVDAIVNAADNSLMGGGGVDLAIHLGAGPELFDECMKIKKEKYPLGLPTGEAIITKGYNLPAKYVIHTVGPIWMGGYAREEELLYKCYFNSLLLAKENNIKVIAFPEISTGVYAYPKEQAKEVADKAISDFCAKYPGEIEEIVLVSFP